MDIGDARYIRNLRRTTNPVTATLPNGDVIISTHEGEIDLPTLPAGAVQCDVFSAGLECGSLLSIGKLCDHNLVAVFDDISVKIYKKNAT